VERQEAAVQVAQQAFNCLGYTATEEHLGHSVLATAWKMGLPTTPLRDGGDGNPWAAVSIHYHYQEALMFRFWAMQAELLFGYLSKIMRMTEEELAVPVRASEATPLEVLRAMTNWALVRAMQRAKVVGSPGEMAPDEAVKIYNTKVLRYEALVTASAQEFRSVPVKGFQLPLARDGDGPWKELLCYGADNLCDALAIEDHARPITTMVMQLASNQIQTSLYRSLIALP